MKLRYILPGLFLLGICLWVTANVLGAGHGAHAFDFFAACAYPAVFLVDLLPGLPDWLSNTLALVAGTIQWFLIGYLVDKWWQRRRAESRTQPSDER